MRNFKLIRYEGGAGGERLTSIVSQYVDSATGPESSNNNRIQFNDLFESAFQLEWPKQQLIKTFSLPNQPWWSINDCDIRNVVNYYKNKNKHTSVGKAHYIFDTNLDYKVVFDDFKILDIKNITSQLWITKSLQLYKSGCGVLNHLNLTSPADSYKEQIQAHYVEHGWWPEYWLWYGVIPWDNFINLEVENVFQSNLSSKDNVADVVIDAATLVTDVTLSWMPALNEFLNVSELDKQHIDILIDWVNGNLDILKQLGLIQYLNTELSSEDQKQLLKDTFKPLSYLIYDRGSIVSRAGGSTERKGDAK